MKLLIIISIFYLSIYSESKDSLMSNESFVPQWAKSAIWYQIFPERFRNGDISNDPKVENIKGAWPQDAESPWEVHAWNSDWYELQPYEKLNGKDIWFNIQRRRYGGDLQGIIDKLDYLKHLGITAIYLNPIFVSPSMHKYDGATFHHVDPNFGPNPESDREKIKSEIPHDPATWVWTEADKLFLKLIKEVHKNGMRIIIDGVFNHMGINSWAFKDVVKNQKNSLYKDWFKIKSWDDDKLKTKFEYDGWYGVRELPELMQDENGIVNGPKKYIFDITQRWMDPNNDGSFQDGIDGWRLDVAFMIKHQFWKDWRKHVKSINNEAYITAEIINSVEANKEYLKGDEFDAVMNYNFAFACSEFFIDNKSGINASKFDEKLKTLREAYPKEVSFVMQNLFDSHDTARLLSQIVNKDIHKFRDWGNYFEISKGSNPKFDTRAPNNYDLQKMKLMAIMQMTYIGAPMIYYGDEVGMWGSNDPCCRKPMLWDDYKYKSESLNPDQTERENECEVKVNMDLFNHYKKLISIRKSNIELNLGEFNAIQIDDSKNIFVFERIYENEKTIVLLNNSNEEQVIDINLNREKKYNDLLNNEVIDLPTIKLKPNWGRIIKEL